MLSARGATILSRLFPARAAEGLNGYAVAVALTLLAFVVTEMLDTWLPETRFSAFYAAVVIAAWYGGLRPGLLAAGLSVAIIAFASTAPEYSFGFAFAGSAVPLVAFLIEALLVSSLAELSRRAVQRAEEAERRVTILADASSALISSLDFETTLANITALAVPAFADWCTVNILQADGTIERLALTHRDPAGAEALTEIQHRYPVRLDTDHPLARVISSGQPGLYTDITPEMQVAWTEDDEHRRLVSQLGTSSVIVAPMWARGRVLGAIIFARAGGSAYVEDDLTLAVTLARRAALAIDNAQLFRAAQESETRYRNLFEGSEDVIVVIGDDGRYLDINPAIEKLLGYTREEMLSKRAGDLLHRRDLWLANAQPIFERDGVWHGEAELRHKDGRLVPIESRMTRVELPGGWVTVAAWRDISERRAVERLQQEFIVMVTHDLKTPLTSIKGLAQLMQRRQAYNDEALATIVGQSDHLERLINDLLDVARLEAGRLELRPAPVDLVELAEETVIQVRTASRRTIRVETAEQQLVHSWDGDRLRQVLLNLLTNAVKYSPNGSEIVVRIEDDAGQQQARVSVSDQGIGIPPEALPRLFRRFYRVEQTLTAGDGLGLGLYIARSLVEAHGGRIEAHSPPDGGSVFSFTLPYRG